MAENKTVLVIGGGFSGLTAAVEAAEAGCDVVIVEKNPYLGGRVAQLNKYFWKLCPPNCGLEIQFKRIKNSSQVRFLTLAEVEEIKGEEGNFDVTVKVKPRYVNDKCVGCDACAQACPSHRSNDFNFGMDKTKAAYIPFNQAFPFQYVIDDTACAKDCMKACAYACKYDAIDLNMKPETIKLKAGAIVMATGWSPYDATRMDILGFGRVQNVITNMMMERLSAPNGPTSGRIVRPSDGKEVKNIAFVQCAGSRDENHLPYCSYICCLASLKQAMYVREQYPDSKAQVFYIDLRTPGLYEHRFLWKAKEDPNVTLTKGKVAGIAEDPATKDVIVEVEDVFGGKKIKASFDMVVLATGMVPGTKETKIAKDVTYTPDGFVDTSAKKGVYAVGTLKSPVDVARSAQDATGVVIKSIQSLRRK
ncbi:MAG TPA: CoB--CoM heterodisulfide reductase iron-sulfur subunit A family protein [Thermodesulfovibrionales bacterium]|nr:CoB--CoM heterodisulfide reductase iron-sulfur subunit A family protein [Thermodesulfovibrionales bacterium]